MRGLLHLIATFFGIGKVKIMPGTFGTLATIPLFIILSGLGPYFYMGFVVLLIPIGIIAADAFQKDHGGHDRQEIVVDEVIGYLITMTWLPMNWRSVLVGFILFRILDIWKPFPIGYLDKKIQGGLGVIADDVAAGLIANVALQIVLVKTDWLGVQLG